MTERNEFLSGDNRDDRDQDPFMTLGDDPSILLNDSKSQNETENPEFEFLETKEESLTITDGDTVPEKKKFFTIKNGFFAIAGIFVLYIVYAIVTAPSPSQSAQKSQPTQSKQEEQKKNQTKEQLPASLLKDDLNKINSEISTLKSQIVMLQRSNDDLSAKYASSLEKISLLEQQGVSSGTSIDTNDLTTKVIASVLPEIKKHSEANAARVKKDILKSLNQGTTKQGSTTPATKTDSAKVVTTSEVQDGPRNLVFVMATKDLMLVTAQDDPTERVITLRPGEFVKGRGLIRNISPRGCIIFEDNTKYEVINREGSCSNVQ